MLSRTACSRLHGYQVITQGLQTVSVSNAIFFPLCWPKGPSVISDALRIQSCWGKQQLYPRGHPSMSLWRLSCRGASLLSMALPCQPKLEQAPSYPLLSCPLRFLCTEWVTSTLWYLCHKSVGLGVSTAFAQFWIQNDPLTRFTTNLVIFSKQDIVLCDISCPHRTKPHAGPKFSQTSAQSWDLPGIHNKFIDLCQT